MVEEYDLDPDIASPSIYEAELGEKHTGTVRKSRGKVNTAGNHFLSYAKAGVPNGVRQGVMSRGPNAKMAPSTTVPEPNINLSREELLKLLSVFEGELQARDEVIDILKSERPNNPALHERYGLSNMPLRALQRDAASLDATTKDHVAEQTSQNLQKIIQHQKDSYKKLKQALLAAEQANQRLAMEITDEKKKHQEYMIKSDDFVNLLEEERERLKIALDKEKEINERRENEMTRKFASNKDELTKLKSLSLVLVEERQNQVSELAEHKKQITDLERRLKEAEIKCKESQSDITLEKEHAMELENDLENQSNKFFQNQEEFNAKLREEREKNEQLEEKVKTLTQQLKKLKTVQKNLQKTDDQLWRIHEKLEKDEEHDLLLEEVELLRQRVKDMEEGEKIYTQASEECKEIQRKLEDEITLTRSLRSQMKTLQTQVKAQKDLQRTIEDADFRFDELQLKFDFEKRKSNDMKEQLQKMKAKMSELDQYEAIVQGSEEKMNKMKEQLILLTDQKKCGDDQVKFLIEKNQKLKNETKIEKDKVTEITEKLIHESKKVLKIREELSQEKQKSSSQLLPVQQKLNEAQEKIKELSSNKQSQAEEANDRLRRQVIMLKTRLDQLEAESEEKETKLAQLLGPPEQAPGTTKGMTDLVEKLHSAEKRCENLSCQLQDKTELCEDLTKQITQMKQVNNNSNVKDSSVAPVTQNESACNVPTQATKTRGLSLARNSDNSGTIKKNPASIKSVTSKVTVGSTSQLPSPGNKAPFTSSRVSTKPPVSPASTLVRSGKVVPVTFHIAKKPPTSSSSPQPPVEVTFTQEVGPTKKASSANGTTIKITRDGQTGAPVIKTVTEPQTLKVQQKPVSASNDKGVNVTNQDSKIPKHHGAPKYFRTFQAQKDFNELQKKWASKIGK